MANLALAHKVSRENNALVKLKTLLVDKEGATLEGVDALAALGVTESSRSLRNLKNFLSGISPELIKSSAQNFPHQSTIDNLDLKIDDVLHQMTLEFIELEQHCTSDLDTTEKSVEEALEFFDEDTLLLTSDKNKELLNQLEKVVATSVGREIASRVPGAQFLNKALKNHHDHPTSKLDRNPAILFVKKPQYLSEMKNTDMIKICQKLQLDFLELTAEHVLDKEAFLVDLKLANTIDCDIPEREEADKRIHDSVREAGLYIGHGDQLTFQRFYEAKRLCRTSVTAIERLEYLAHFRLALFHTKMSKTFMDYKACMVNDNNVDDPVTISYFKAYLGLDCISNQESKIKKTGAYEIHDQFVTEVGMQFLSNAFENYMEKNAETLNVETEADAQTLILDFLRQNQIFFYFDPESSVETDQFDDLLSYSRDLCSRTVLSLVSDKMEEECDALGLQAFRISMIIYFLNRKQTVQDSKYASSLLLDLVQEFKPAKERNSEWITLCV